MNSNLRKSFSVKMTALGFCVLILFGNFWVLDKILGKSTPEWMSWIGFCGLLAVIVGGISIVITLLLEKSDGKK